MNGVETQGLETQVVETQGCTDPVHSLSTQLPFLGGEAVRLTEVKPPYPLPHQLGLDSQGSSGDLRPPLCGGGAGEHFVPPSLTEPPIHQTPPPPCWDLGATDLIVCIPQRNPVPLQSGSPSPGPHAPSGL
ncbi:unnamed protein product [Arctogadus glacialis]